MVNAARCLAAREQLPLTTRILDSGAYTTVELAEMVLDAIDAGLTTCNAAQHSKFQGLGLPDVSLSSSSPRSDVGGYAADD